MPESGVLAGADVLDASVDAVRRSRRAKTRIVLGQAFIWSPPGASRSSPVASTQARPAGPRRAG